jgi:hypothetical protein
MANLEHDLPISTTSVFDIASTSSEMFNHLAYSNQSIECWDREILPKYLDLISSTQYEKHLAYRQFREAYRHGGRYALRNSPVELE